MIKKIIAFLFILVVGWAFFSWITQPAPPRVFKNEFMSFEIPEGYEISAQVDNGRWVELAKDEQMIIIAISDMNDFTLVSDEVLPPEVQHHMGKNESPGGVSYDIFHFGGMYEPFFLEPALIVYRFEKNNKVFEIGTDFEYGTPSNLGAVHKIIDTIQ